MGDGPNDVGSSRLHILAQCDASLKRLGTDHIDIYHMHGFDALTPVEETLDTLNTPRSCRQSPLHRVLELLRLASHEVPCRVARHGWTRYVAIRSITRSSVASTNGS